MKKTALVLAVVLMLSGCGRGSQRTKDYAATVQETISGNYSFTAAFTYEEIEGEAKVEKSSADHITVSMQKPDIMQEMVFTMQGEEITLTYRSMEIDLAGVQFPTESIVSILRQVLSGEESYTIEEQETTVTASAVCGFFHYKILFEKKTMTPQSIEVPELSVTVTITDFTPIKNT